MARNTKTKREAVCYGQVVFHGHIQEWYETASRDAGRRARQLRKAGWRVHTEGMGPQVTGVGVVKMTLLTAYGDTNEVPPVKRERI